MSTRTGLAALALALAAAGATASAADLPRAAGGYAPGDAGGQGEVPAVRMPDRWVDPIHVGAVLPRSIPLRPMPERYAILGYGYAFVNGQPLLIDRGSREIVLLLPDQ